MFPEKERKKAIIYISCSQLPVWNNNRFGDPGMTSGQSVDVLCTFK